MFHKCTDGEDSSAVTGARKLGIETVPPISTEVIVLDWVATHGKDGMVPAGTALDKADVEAAMERRSTGIEKGDVVLFPTGWIPRIGKDHAAGNKTGRGLGKEGAPHLVGNGVAAVGADSRGLEVLPFEKGTGVFGIPPILLGVSGI